MDPSNVRIVILRLGFVGTVFFLGHGSPHTLVEIKSCLEFRIVKLVRLKDLFLQFVDYLDF